MYYIKSRLFLSIADWFSLCALIATLGVYLIYLCRYIIMTFNGDTLFAKMSSHFFFLPAYNFLFKRVGMGTFIYA